MTEKQKRLLKIKEQFDRNDVVEITPSPSIDIDTGKSIYSQMVDHRIKYVKVKDVVVCKPPDRL